MNNYLRTFLKSFLLFSIFLIPTATLIGQVPSMDNARFAYGIGSDVIDAVKLKDHRSLTKYFKDTTNLSFLIRELGVENMFKKKPPIRKIIMWNNATKHFEFLAYSAEYIPTDDQWGLTKYFFILQIEIDIQAGVVENQILSTTIIRSDEKESLKKWWRAYMESYRDPKYMKKEIAAAHGMPPPPPPPPESKDWY